MQDLFAAYLSGAASEFFPHHFADPLARRHAVVRAGKAAPEVIAALHRQNAALPASAARTAQIDALAQGAAAVVTGQQVGLFLGPLFTLYKAASAVRVARALTEESGRPVVPIFWLQTEDHDLPEIATCHVPTTHGSHALAHPAAASERISIAHRVLEREVETCCAELRTAIAHLPHADEHMHLLQRHYQTGTGWAPAFAGMLAELFAPEGLIILDPRDSAIAQLATPVHRKALTDAASIANLLVARGDALVAAGFAPAVHVRPHAPLSFFHPDGVTGARFRLDATADGYSQVGAESLHDRTAVLARLEVDPSSFSTSALLRPILQDYLLPTAAYVAGPGEVAYFAQLGPLYSAFDLTMPVIVPRARFRIVDARTRRLLDDLHLTAADLQRSEDDLLTSTQGVDARVHAAELARHILEPLAVALADVSPQLEASGPGLDAALSKTRATIERAVTKLAAKYESALLHRSQATVAAVRELRMRLYPNGIPQERHYGIASYAARWGGRALIERVLAAIDPFAASVLDLEWADSGSATAAAAEARR